MSWEGFFNFIWVLIQCLFWLGALVGALILVFAMIVGCWRGVKKWFPKKGQPSLEDYMAEATTVGMGMYKDDIFMPEELLKAFKAGARWGWGFHRRK